jgi:Ca2+-transporting ATPase
MLFKGAAVTCGFGKGVAVATGMETELGNISSLVEEAEEEVTPLQRRLSQLGHRLIWVTLGIAGLVTALGVLRGRDLLLMIRSRAAGRRWLFRGRQGRPGARHQIVHPHPDR